MKKLYKVNRGKLVEVQKESRLDFPRFVSLIPTLKGWTLLDQHLDLGGIDTVLMFDQVSRVPHILINSDVATNFELCEKLINEAMFRKDEIGNLIKQGLNDLTAEPYWQLMDVISVVRQVFDEDRKEAKQHPYIEMWAVTTYAGDMFSIERFRENTDLPGFLICLKMKVGELLEMLRDPAVQSGGVCQQKGASAEAQCLRYVRLSQFKKKLTMDSFFHGEEYGLFICQGISKDVESDDIFDVLISRAGLNEWLRHQDPDSICTLMIRDDQVKIFGPDQKIQNILTLPLQQYKNLPYLQEAILDRTTVPASVFRRALQMCCSSVPPKHYNNDALTFLHVEVVKKEGSGQFVAYGSDGHQLFIFNRVIKVAPREEHALMKFAIPHHGIAKLIDLLEHVDGTVELCRTIAGGMIKWGQRFQCFDGPKKQMPSLHPVLDRLGHETTITDVRREDLLQAVRQGCAAMVGENEHSFVLKRINDELHACFTTKDGTEDADCSCPAKFWPVEGTNDKPDFKLQYRPILEVLAKMDDDVLEMCGTPNDVDPVVFRGQPSTGWTWLLMPMKRK